VRVIVEGKEGETLPNYGGWEAGFPVFGGFGWAPLRVFGGKGQFGFGTGIASVTSVRDQVAGKALD
jgi:hypothetical protein